MDPVVQSVLKAFDELGREAVEFSALAEFIPSASKGRAKPADTAALRTLLAQLVEQGWLCPAGAPDAFVRTEDGRLALAGPRDVTLYTRPGCHLCEEAEAQITPLLAQFGANLREVNIEADPALRERYNDDVPVIFLGARKVAKHRVNLEQFRRQLASAAVNSR